MHHWCIFNFGVNFPLKPAENSDTNATEPRKDNWAWEKCCDATFIITLVLCLCVFVFETERHLWVHTKCLSHNLDLFLVILVLRLFVLPALALHLHEQIHVHAQTHTNIFRSHLCPVASWQQVSERTCCQCLSQRFSLYDYLWLQFSHLWLLLHIQQSNKRDLLLNFPLRASFHYFICGCGFVKTHWDIVCVCIMWLDLTHHSVW